jgi:hypothetical protein
MEATEYRNVCTIDHVIETIEKTLNECENASERLGSDAKALRPVGRDLNRVQVQLESIMDDDEVLMRMSKITIGAEAIPFLDQLDRDLSAICTYLQNTTSPLREDEVDGYGQAMGRYAEVLKVVLSRNKTLV